MKKKGISLITLVITIVVLIILAAAVILSISNNNPINDAKKAKIASTIDTFKSDLSVQISNKLLKEPMITINEIDSDEIKEGLKITDLVPSIKGTEYENELIIINGKLKLKKDSSFPEEKQEIIIELLGTIEEVNESDDNDDENEEIIPEQKTYQITYDVNGGNELFENQTKKENETLVLNTNVPTKEGYIFEGWKATDETIYQPGTEYIKNEETVLTAQWKGITYTIKYNSNGGTGTMNDSVHIYDVAKNLTTNTFTKSGYTFVGWATSESGSVVYNDNASINNLTTVQDEQINLYAIWEERIAGTLNFSSSNKNNSTTFYCSLVSNSQAGGTGISNGTVPSGTRIEYKLSAFSGSGGGGGVVLSINGSTLENIGTNGNGVSKEGTYTVSSTSTLEIKCTGGMGGGSSATIRIYDISSGLYYKIVSN